MRHPRTHVSHTRELYYILCIVALVVMTSFSIWGPGGYMELRQLRHELDSQRKRVEELRQSNAKRLETIQSLRSSRESVEKEAREKGYGRQGEIIQQLR